MRHHRCFALVFVATTALTLMIGCPTIPTEPPPEQRCRGVECDDGNLCTTDSCVATTGVCTNVNNTNTCDDGDPCTSGDVCFTGACNAGTPIAGCCTFDADCAAGENCTNNLCATICITDADCDDEFFCNGTETCGFDGDCRDGTEPCGDDETCNEDADRCETALVLELKYFEHAKVAEEQANSGQIPTILRENGESLILQMPTGQGIEGWDPGTIILVQNEHGTRSYKYVVYAAQLANGTVAVIVQEATLLSAVDEATMIDAIEANTKTRVQPKVIIDDSFDFRRTIDLSDYSIDLGDHATINWVNAGIDFDFTIRARLEIDSVALETIEAGYTLVSGKVSEAASRVAALLDDGKIDSEEDIRLLEDRLENDEDFRNQVGDILDTMEDSERIKDAFVAIDGTLSGVFQPEFILSASGGGERVFPILPQDILVPLGPIPTQVSLNVSLVFGADISGEVRLTTGMEFGVRLHAEADWQTRSATAYTTALGGWNGVFLRSIDPIIDANASFSVKAGVQPEIGLTLFQILGFTINPEIYARLEAEASGSGECVQLSYELLGGFDASVRGEALVWQTDEWSFFNREWSLLPPNIWGSSGCGAIPVVILTAPNTVNDGQSYIVSWTASSNPTRYLLQESTSSNFAGASNITLSADTTSKTFSHEVSADTRYYYRVVAENADTGESSDWSNTDSTLVSVGHGGDPPSCLVSPTLFNFDQVEIGSSMDRTFVIENTGGGTLAGSVSESCSHFSIVSGGSYSLGAGQTQNVTLRFRPTSSGQKECLIDTGHDDCNAVVARGVGGNPPAVCDRGWVDNGNGNFGTEPVGGSGHFRSLGIENTGGGTLHIDNPSSSCSHFTIILGSNPDFDLGPSERLTVGVLFRPTSSGTKNCTISLGTDCGNVSVTGVGQ